ncbi:carbohydrate ABC transporter permease [Cohnella silvisoli]|uniref:Carbohydrate ABC transporter permease n=1 Tax=Cohnella silvisoli TaxID=2873699 RepID=A0ABV1L248_9BACL|nr:carbohydrate ABC transporter permease [Cohnella silvisoli]MCD9025702.1 carbohydrate ABC transporter permease [Cohnella silvisoli]
MFSRFDSRLGNGLLYLVAGAAAALCLAPFIHSIAVSFSDKSSVAAGYVFFWPVKFTVSAYTLLLNDVQFFKSFLISVQRVLLGGSLSMILTLLMAYPLSKETEVFRSRNLYIWIIVSTMLFNGGLIPWYMTIKTLHLTNTIWGLVIPGAVAAFNVILMINFFRALPKELQDAGGMDGAGPIVLLMKIYVPLSLPSLATIGLFTIVGHWNAFFDGMILMDDPKDYPLQTYIQQLVVSERNFANLTVEELKRLSEVSNKTLNTAKILISMLPILAIYPFLQKYFTKGIVLGSVKE